MHQTPALTQVLLYLVRREFLGMRLQQCQNGLPGATSGFFTVRRQVLRSPQGPRNDNLLYHKPTVSPAKNSLVYFISIAYIDRPVVRGHCQEAKRGEAGGQRIPRNCEVLGTFLRTCATTELSLIAMWRLIGATPRGQPWTPAVTLPQGRDGLSARRMAVLWTFRAPSLCRHVPHELMRNAALNLTLIIPATACHQRNDVERYSRSITSWKNTLPMF
jgi:hypothetical protein